MFSTFMFSKVSVAGVFSSPKRAHVQSMCCSSSACLSWFCLRIHQCPCIKYNDFQNCAQKHVSSAWHRQFQEDATRFLKTVLHPERRVDSLLGNAFNATVSSNQGCGSGYFSNASASTPIASASTNKKRKNNR